MAVILNFILLILIIVGMFKRREKACLKSLMYYTILSNLINAFASLLVLIFGLKYFVEVIRYLSVCMMVMTFFVTACILMPLSKGSRPFLYKGSGLLHHFICPALLLTPLPLNMLREASWKRASGTCSPLFEVTICRYRAALPSESISSLFIWI